MTSPNDRAKPDPLDALILAACDGEWCKVAVFIAKVMDASKSQSIATTGQAIAARLYALAAQGSIDVEGNVRRWRAASVRKVAGA